MRMEVELPVDQAAELAITICCRLFGVGVPDDAAMAIHDTNPSESVSTSTKRDLVVEMMPIDRMLICLKQLQKLSRNALML